MFVASVIGLLVACGPGLLLGFAVPSGRDRWLLWAGAPALTLGLVTIAMAWLPRVGLPNGVVAVLVTELVLAVLFVVASRLLARHDRWAPRWRRDGRPEAGPVVDADTHAGPTSRFGRLLRPLRAWDLVGLGVPAVVSVGVGWLILGRMNAAPGWDAMNHAFMTRRIVDTGSTSITDACVTGALHPQVACEIYPLAANITWAQTSVLGGARISDTMMAWVIVVAPLALVAGVYAAVRYLGASPLVAACAALAPTFIGPMWTAMLIGRPTQQYGPAVYPAIALLVASAVKGRRPVRMGALAGLAGAGLVMTHTYDALPVPFLALGILLVAGIRHLRLLDVAKAAASLAVSAALTAGVFLAQLAGTNGAVALTPPYYVGKLGEAVVFWVLDPMRYVVFGYPAPESSRNFPLEVLPTRIAVSVTIVCLLASPLCLFIRSLRWARPWFLLWCIVTPLGIWTSTSDGATAQAVAGLWYGTRDRLRAVLIADYGILAVAGACVIGWLVAQAVRAVPRVDHRRVVALLPRVAVAGFILMLVVTGLQKTSWQPLRDDMVRRTPASAAYPRVFAWLATHTGAGDTVGASSNLEFFPWMYADYGVKPLFGMNPHTQPGSVPDAQARRRAWDWLVGRRGARPAGCDVVRYGVRYVVSSATRIPGETWPVLYKKERLAASPAVRPVHRDGPITVYEVTPLGRECDSPS